MKFGSVIVIILVILISLGCDDQSSNINPQAASSNQVTQVAKPSRVHVTKSEFGETWPLTVDEGDIELIDGTFAVFHTNEKSYALNGSAQSKGYPEIDPIWAPNPSIPGAKKNISALIDKALALK